MRAVTLSRRPTRKFLQTTCRSLEGSAPHLSRLNFHPSISLLRPHPSPDPNEGALRSQRSTPRTIRARASDNERRTHLYPSCRMPHDRHRRYRAESLQGSQGTQGTKRRRWRMPWTPMPHHGQFVPGANSLRLHLLLPCLFRSWTRQQCQH